MEGFKEKFGAVILFLLSTLCFYIAYLAYDTKIPKKYKTSQLEIHQFIVEEVKRNKETYSIFLKNKTTTEVQIKKRWVPKGVFSQLEFLARSKSFVDASFDNELKLYYLYAPSLKNRKNLYTGKFDYAPQIISPEKLYTHHLNKHKWTTLAEILLFVCGSLYGFGHALILWAKHKRDKRQQKIISTKVQQIKSGMKNENIVFFKSKKEMLLILLLLIASSLAIASLIFPGEEGYSALSMILFGWFVIPLQCLILFIAYNAYKRRNHTITLNKKGVFIPDKNPVIFSWKTIGKCEAKSRYLGKSGWQDYIEVTPKEGNPMEVYTLLYESSNKDIVGAINELKEFYTKERI